MVPTIMRFSVLYVTGLVLGSASANVLPSPSISDPTITPPPRVAQEELLKKQVANNFLGWIYLDGTWSSDTCAVGGTYYQSGSYARCCSTSAASCNVVVGCVDGSMIYAPSTASTRTTIACTSIWTESSDRSYTVCNTASIFENIQDSNPHSNIFCGVSPLNWSYYRVRPTDASSTKPTTSSPTTSSSTTTSTPTPASTSSDNPQPTQTTTSSKASSKAWIAGVVIGPIAAIAIAGLVVWIILLKRKHKKADTTNSIPPTTPHQSFPPGAPNNPTRDSYMAFNPQMQQVYPGGMAPYSADASQHQRASYMSNGQGPSPTTASQSPGLQQGQTSPYGPLSNSPQPGQMYPQHQAAQQWQPIPQPNSPQMMSAQYPQDPIVVDAGGVYKTPSPALQPEWIAPQPQQGVR